MYCKNCKEFHNGMSYCPVCGESENRSTQPRRRVIGSISEMNDFLSELKNQASISIQETINAQMMVVRYVQSPTLIDTTFDSLIYSLKKSLKAAESKEMAIRIQEQFSIMIQNYVFFLDARMQYSLDEHKREGQQLLSEAGDILAASVVSAAELAAGDYSSSDVVVHNIFKKSDLGGKSFFSRVISWFVEDSNTDEKKVEFYKTLALLFEKLSKYQKIIGKSMLISEMIKRYTPNIVEHSEIAQEYNICNAKIREKEESNDGALLFWGLGFLSLLLWPMILFVIHLFTFANPEPFDYSSYNKMHWIVTGVILLICMLGPFLETWSLSSESSSCLAKMEEMGKSLEQISVQFEDNDDDFMDLLQ